MFKKFSTMTIQRRLFFLPFIALAGLIILQISDSWIEGRLRRDFIAPGFEDRILTGYKRTLKAAVDVEAVALSERLKSLKTKEEKNVAIISETDAIRFFDDKSGYFFTYETSGIRINVPINKSQNGQNLIGVVDADKVAFVAELIKQAQAGGGFVRYRFEKPGKGVQPKLGYATMIPGTDIVIGTGVYIDNVAEETDAWNQQLTAKHREFATVIAIVCLLILALTSGIVFLVARSVKSSIKGIAEEMLTSSDEVASAAGQVSASSQSLAEGASEQAASLEQTSSGLEEVAGMTRDNSTNMQKVNELGKQTRAAAEKGATDMQAMSAAVDDIKLSSNEIAKIIKTIDEIAFQTNILALNAAVEAARAGEAGMGFAVVAEEVRNLAQRSATAARDTAEKIEAAIAKANQGVEISAKVNERLQDILEKARQVDEVATQVTSASQAQNQGIEQVNAAVAHMDGITQSTAASAEQSASAAVELNAQADALKHAVLQLSFLVSGTTSSSRKQTPPKAPPKTRKTEIKEVVVSKPAKTEVQPNLKRLPAKRPEKIADIPMDNDFKNF